MSEVFARTETRTVQQSVRHDDLPEPFDQSDILLDLEYVHEQQIVSQHSAAAQRDESVLR